MHHIFLPHMCGNFWLAECNFWLAECFFIECSDVIVFLKTVLVLVGSFKFFVDQLDLFEAGF